MKICPFCLLNEQCFWENKVVNRFQPFLGNNKTRHFLINISISKILPCVKTTKQKGKTERKKYNVPHLFYFNPVVCQ